MPTGVPTAPTAKKAMPTLAGPVLDTTVVLTPPNSTPLRLTTWFIRESLALSFSSGSLPLIGGELSASRSGVGPNFWVAPVLIGRPYVSLRSTTWLSCSRGLLPLSEPVPVSDQAAIRLSSGALFWNWSSGPPVISSSVPLRGLTETEGWIDPQNGRFRSLVGTVPTSR